MLQDSKNIPNWAKSLVEEVFKESENQAISGSNHKEPTQYLADNAHAPSAVAASDNDTKAFSVSDASTPANIAVESSEDQAKKIEWLQVFLSKHFELISAETGHEVSNPSYRYNSNNSKKTYTDADLKKLVSLLNEAIEKNWIGIDSSSFSISQLFYNFGVGILDNFYSHNRFNKEAICYQLLNLPMALGIITFLQAYYDEFDHKDPNISWAYSIVAPSFLSMARTIYGFVTKVSHMSEDELRQRINNKKENYKSFIKGLEAIFDEDLIVVQLYSEMTNHTALRRFFSVDLGIASMVASAMFTDMALALKLLPGLHVSLRLMIGIVLGIADSFDGANAVLVADEHVDLSDQPNRLPVLMRTRGFSSRYLSHPVFSWPARLFVDLIAASTLSYSRYLTLKDNLPINGVDVETARVVSLAYNLAMYLVGLRYGFVFSQFGRENVLDYLGVDKTQQLSPEVSAFLKPIIHAFPLLFIANYEGLGVVEALTHVVGPGVGAEYIALLGLKACFPNGYKQVVEYGFVESAWRVLMGVNKPVRGALAVAGGAMTAVGVLKYENRWLAASGAVPLFMSVLSALSQRNLNKLLFIILGTLYYQVIYLNSVMTLTAPPMEVLRPNETNSLQTVEMSYDAVWKMVLVIFFTLVAGFLAAICDVNALLNKILVEKTEANISEATDSIESHSADGEVVDQAQLLNSDYEEQEGGKKEALEGGSPVSSFAGNLSKRASKLVDNAASFLGSGSPKRRLSMSPSDRGTPLLAPGSGSASDSPSSLEGRSSISRRISGYGTAN